MKSEKWRLVLRPHHLILFEGCVIYLICSLRPRHGKRARLRCLCSLLSGFTCAQRLAGQCKPLIGCLQGCCVAVCFGKAGGPVVSLLDSTVPKLPVTHVFLLIIHQLFEYLNLGVLSSSNCVDPLFWFRRYYLYRNGCLDQCGCARLALLFL